MASSPDVYTGVPATAPVQQKMCDTTLAVNDNDDAEEESLLKEQPRRHFLSLWGGRKKNSFLGFLMAAASMGAALVGNQVIESLCPSSSLLLYLTTTETGWWISSLVSTRSPSMLLYSSLLATWYIVGCEAEWWIFGRVCQCFVKKREKERLTESVKFHCIRWNIVSILCVAACVWMVGGTALAERLSWCVGFWIYVTNSLYTCWHLTFVHQRMLNQLPPSEEDENIA